MKKKHSIIFLVLAIIAVLVGIWLTRKADTGQVMGITSTGKGPSISPLSPISALSSPILSSQPADQNDEIGSEDIQAAVSAALKSADEQLKLGNTDKALDQFNLAITLDPQNAYAYAGRGATYAARGELEKAMVDYDKAIELDPHNSVAYNNRGLVYLNSEDYKRAVDEFTKAIEADDEMVTSNDLAVYFNHRAVALMNLGQLDQALEDLEQAINLNVTYSSAHNNRGLAYVALENYDEAITNFTDAINLDPLYGNAYNNRGTAYHRLEDLDHALADFTKAIELDSKDAKLYLNRGLVYVDLNEAEAAKTDFLAYLELYPDSPKREQVEAYIADLKKR